MSRLPVLAVTMGDPSGVGPEIVVKALGREELFTQCLPVVVGDKASLELTLSMLGSGLALNVIEKPEQAIGRCGTIDLIDMGLLAPGGWALGQVGKTSGHAAFSYVEKGISMAMAGLADGVVTAPINKEAIHLAGHHFSGHTEIFSHFTGTREYAMLLVGGSLRVIHVTTHMSMRKACDAIATERVLRTIRMADFSMKLMGLSGTIAVAGLNAHCSENGLFGSEEADAIIPAIQIAQKEGIAVEGPIPADTVFVKASAGQYDMVVAMYHDQGHIPVKLHGFRMDPKTGQFLSVSGINCTIGLPIIRTSVDHGTAFDKAGLGVANEDSLLDAIKMAVTMAEKIDLIRAWHGGMSHE